MSLGRLVFSLERQDKSGDRSLESLGFAPVDLQTQD